MKTFATFLMSIKRAFFKAVLVGALLVIGLCNRGLVHADQSISDTQGVEASKVHLILTGYTAGPGEDIGAECRTDVVAVYQKFSLAFYRNREWRSRLMVHHLNGDRWTRERIMTFLRGGTPTEKGLAVGANDVVVFYHAGHGVVLDLANPYENFLLQIAPIEGEKDPQVKEKVLLRSEVRDSLLQRGCRGVVILTDCCSAQSDEGQGVKRMKQKGQLPEAGWDMNETTIRNLFLRFRGYVDITAAEIGTSAGPVFSARFGESHGSFTTAFLRATCEKKAISNWSEFATTVQTTTHYVSGGVQKPHVFFNQDSLTVPVKTTVSMQ